MKQPHIHVGIMADTRIIIFFDGVYTCNGYPVEGEQLFARTANGIAWQGSTYESLTFVPEHEEHASFMLQDVTIGSKVSKFLGSIIRTASCSVIMPSSTKSQSIFKAA